MKRRKSLRLGSWDYSWNGYYFITICIKKRQKILGTITGNKMRLSRQGYIVKKLWRDLIKHYRCSLDAFIIMPDHIHGIIIIKDSTLGAISDPAVRANSDPAVRAIYESPHE